MSDTIFGPTYTEMGDPGAMPADPRGRADAVRGADALSRDNLFNARWRGTAGELDYVFVPSEMTGTPAPIAILLSRGFPAGSFESGALWAEVAERELAGELLRGQTTLVAPGLGEMGVAAAWLARTLGYAAIVVTSRAEASRQGDRLTELGARVVEVDAAVGDPGPVRAAARKVAATEGHALLDSGQSLAAYRFHAAVTGRAVLDLVHELQDSDVAEAGLAAFVVPGGIGSMAGAGDAVKDAMPESRIARIVSPHGPDWNENVLNIDVEIRIDDDEVDRYLQLLHDAPKIITDEGFVAMEEVDRLKEVLGLAGLRNVFACARYARAMHLEHTHLMVTVAGDVFQGSPWEVAGIRERLGELDFDEGVERMGLLHDIDPAGVTETDDRARMRLYEDKRGPWVATGAVSVEEHQRLADQGQWAAERTRWPEIDAALLAARQSPV